ncbi:MAG: hypothetical protein WCG66_02455 [bacterium]
MMKPHARLLFFLLSIFCSLPARSQKPDNTGGGPDKKDGVTVIVGLAGKVEVLEKDGAKSTRAEKGLRVPAGATLLTGPNSRVDLALSNGALFQIGDNSRFTIGEFKQDAYEFIFTNGESIRPSELQEFGTDAAVLQTIDASQDAWNKLGSEPTTSMSKFRLSEGSMIGQSKKLKAGSRMEIETPIGTAVIRGTVWMLTVRPVLGSGGSSTYQGQLDVAEGRVDFGNAERSRTVQVQGGYAATIEAKVSPTGNVQVTSLNTTPISPERQTTLLATVTQVAAQQTYFTAVNGTPEKLREAIQSITQPQGEGANQQPDANPNQIGIKDLPPVIPPQPPQPAPPAPTPKPTPTPTPAPTPTPTPTPTPNPSNG